MNAVMIRLIFSALFVLAAGNALGDVAPPDDYVENCTLEKQQGKGETCIQCDVDMTRQDQDFEGKCKPDELKEDGYTQKCSTLGATFAKEIWCKAASNADDTEKEESDEAEEDDAQNDAAGDDANCSAGNVGCAPAAGVVFLLGLAIMVAFRRR